MSDKQPVTPVPAATILMLRDQPGADAPLEVFMVVRHHQIDFASGALVFPGGKADPQDYDTALAPHLDGAADDVDMRAMQVAAIRESFEECGVLLARERGATELVSQARLAELSDYQTSIHKGEVSIAEFVAKENLQLACDQLHHFAHWITPPMMPKRFDTHFFLAVAPADQLALHDGKENVDSVWIPPLDAVADGRAGKRTIIFPTMCQLERLGRHAQAQAAIAETETQAIVPVLPWTEQREDGNYICIPDNAGYDRVEERMPDRG